MNDKFLLWTLIIVSGVSVFGAILFSFMGEYQRSIGLWAVAIYARVRIIEMKIDERDDKWT